MSEFLKSHAAQVVDRLLAEPPAPVPDNWEYKHHFGIVHVKSWGNPMLVITEDKYWRKEHWGYNYWVLERFPTIEEANDIAAWLNASYALPETFNSQKSEEFLLKIQELFPTAKIAAI